MEKSALSDIKRIPPALGDAPKPSALNRRSSFTARAMPTFKFSAALEQAGAKEEEAFSLEQWRLHFKKVFTQSKFGRQYENILIFISLISCFEYIYETYLHMSVQEDRDNLRMLKRIELAFACVFGLDWCLSLFLAEHRVLFLMSFYSMVDLMTVIPIFVTYGQDLPNVNYIYTAREAFLYTAFAMNTTRILRALRIRRKLAKVQDAVERFMGELVLSIIVMILFFASVMQFLEYTYQPHAYHTWMYYIWVTISTVGYGDITPRSTQGRVAAMGIIGFSIISIPKMTNELIEKMALQSVYMRNAYNPKTKRSKHVVICGDLTSTSLDEFFGELFHEDHENVDLNAILLLPSPPTTEIIFLLRDSSFFLNIQYLEGSALVDKDLKRARAQHAVAIFIMTNKFSEKPDEEDAKSILLNLSIKRYVASFNLPPKLFCLQLIRPQNRRHLAREEGDEMSSQDLVVCLNEIKMGVLAKAVMYPGANTLLMNLISSFSDDPVEVGEEEQEAIPITSESGGKSIQEVSSKAWLEEYQKGCDWEIYTTPLAKVFEGAKFCELSFAVYDKLGVVLFALQITDAKIEGASKLLLNPANFIIPSQDLFKIEAFVIAQNKASSDLSFHNMKTNDNTAIQALKNIEAGFQSLSRVNRNITTSLNGLRKTTTVDTKKIAALRTKMGHTNDINIQPEIKTTAASRWKSLKRSNLVAKKVESFSYQEILHQLEDSHMKKEYYLRTTPAELSNCIIKTNVIDEIPFINNHVIIIGKGLSNLFDLIRPLRAKFLGMLRYIVIISSEDIPHDVWSKICIFDAILIIRGSPLEEANLRRAGIFRCAQVVVLADGSNNESTASSVGMEALVDSDAIFSYQLVKRMNASTQIVVEIVNTSNISYLDTTNTSNVENYKFSQQFAAGNLFTTSLLDSIVCQAYYNPSIIKVLNRLISGVDNIEAAELAAEATARVAAQSGETKTTPTAGATAGADAEVQASDSDSDESDTFDTNAASSSKRSPSKKGNAQGGRPSQIGMNSAKVASTKRIKDIQGSCLYQMALPDNFNDRTYGRLYQKLSSQGIIPLGILRGTFSGMSVGPKANRAPYVYTNPEKDTELFKCDKIFVLSTKPIQADSKLDLKDWLLNIQQNKALRSADSSNPKRPGSAVGADLDTLDLTQKKLDARITKLSKEVNHKLDDLVKMMTTLGRATGRGKSFGPSATEEGDDDDEEYYTIDTSSGKVRRGSADSGTSGELTDRSRGRANTGDSVSSTKVMPRSSMRPSSASIRKISSCSGIAEGSNSADSDKDKTQGSDHSGDKIEPLAKGRKSLSLSKLAPNTPNGILRKPADGTPTTTVGNRKRHSFSTPIATVQEVANDHNASFTSTTGDQQSQSEANTLNIESAEVNTISTSHTPSQLLHSNRKVTESPLSDSDVDTSSPANEEQNPNRNEVSPSIINKKELDILEEEGKVSCDEENDPSALSLDIESSSSKDIILFQLQEPPHSPNNELNQIPITSNRTKPVPIRLTTPASPFSPLRKRADVVIDRATISGPPVELALRAINSSRSATPERIRARSAGYIRKDMY